MTGTLKPSDHALLKLQRNSNRFAKCKGNWRAGTGEQKQEQELRSGAGRRKAYQNKNDQKRRSQHKVALGTRKHPMSFPAQRSVARYVQAPAALLALLKLLRRKNCNMNKKQIANATARKHHALLMPVALLPINKCVLHGSC